MRPTEVRAVAALLSTEASSAEELAKAIIKTLDELREDREYYSVNVTIAKEGYSMGPFNTENQAVSAVMAMLGTLDRDEALRYVRKMIPPGILSEPTVQKQLRQWCVKCEHPMVAHDWPSAKVPRGCMVGYDPKDRDAGCQCGRV